MRPLHDRHVHPRFISVYEILIWLIYVGIFKYGNYVSSEALPRLRTNFPFPELILFSAAMTLYVIPYYRLIGPYFLEKKQYAWLFLVTLLYFVFFANYFNRGIIWLFSTFHHHPVLTIFYKQALTGGVRLQTLLMDLLAFLSVMFMRYSFTNERKKHALEKDNLELQLETLKAQLHPHFLFNMLNSIYGMSLAGSAETSSYILRLSDMMRYMLYDCRQHRVPLEKDIEFLHNYLQMEKKRYPDAAISFTTEGEQEGKTIAPLLLIPFMENSFKHGAHRINAHAFIKGSLSITDNALLFELANSKLPVMPEQPGRYGGVGIGNVQKRLALYYPGRHTLTINGDSDIYTVHLTIQL